MDRVRKSPCGYSKALPPELVLDAVGRALAEEELIGRASLVDSGEVGMLATTDGSKAGLGSWFEFSIMIVGVRGGSGKTGCFDGDAPDSSAFRVAMMGFQHSIVSADPWIKRTRSGKVRGQWTRSRSNAWE